MFLSKKYLKLIIFFSLLIPFSFKFLNFNYKIIKHIYFSSPLFFNKNKICKDYDLLVKNSFDDTFSVSIIDQNGSIISEYNQNRLRIPASNIKLFSTAYILSKYNIFDNITTSIYIDKNNNLYLYGSGDPDFSIQDFDKLLKSIRYSNKINLSLFEINNDLKWPKGWTNSDKLFNYGSPLTSLAINSNEDVNKDINFLFTRTYNYLRSKYPQSKIDISIREYMDFDKNDLKIIKEINSNPIISLITLVNSESHNFTAEILFKNASKSWGSNDYSSLKYWLRNKGLPVKNIKISDASGLSRDNLITTKLIASFLHKMKFNYKFNSYNSSLSIIGIRGTLAKRLKNNDIKGKFFGKTGTLSNVFALSGYLYKDNGPITISIIQNSSRISPNKVFKFLSDIYLLKTC